MKKQRIYELMDGIYEEFILEAEPKFLTDLQTAPAADTPTGEARILSVPDVSRPVSRPAPRPAKQWMTAACLALAILMALPLCLGGVAMIGIGGISGGGLTSILDPGFWVGCSPSCRPMRPIPTNPPAPPRQTHPARMAMIGRS